MLRCENAVIFHPNTTKRTVSVDDGVTVSSFCFFSKFIFLGHWTRNNSSGLSCVCYVCRNVLIEHRAAWNYYVNGANSESSHVETHKCVCERYSVAVWTITVRVYACVCARSCTTTQSALTRMCLESHIASRCHGKSLHVKDSPTCFIRLTNPRQVQPLPRLSTTCWWLVIWVENPNGHNYGFSEISTFIKYAA